MTEEAKEQIRQAIDELEAALPVDIRTLPVEALTPPQALRRASLLGLYQLVRIIEQPLDPDDLRQQRLIGDMAFGANKLFPRVARGEFRARGNDVIERLLAAMEAEKDQKLGPSRIALSSPSSADR